MSVESELFTHGVALPAGIASSGILAARVFPCRVRPVVRASAMAVAYVVAHGELSGWPTFPPRDVADWLPYGALLGVLLGVALPRLGRVRFPLLVGTVALGLWLLLGKLSGRLWSGGQSAAWFAGCGLALLAMWVPLGAPRCDVTARPIALGATALASAVCVLLAYSARYAAFCAATAAATAPLAVLALLRARRPAEERSRDGIEAGESAPGHLVLGGLLVVMLHFAEVRLAIVALLALGLGMLPLAERWSAKASSRRAGALWIAVLTGLPLLAAIALSAWVRAHQPVDPYADYY